MVFFTPSHPSRLYQGDCGYGNSNNDYFPGKVNDLVQTVHEKRPVLFTVGVKITFIVCLSTGQSKTKKETPGKIRAEKKKKKKKEEEKSVP